VARFAAEFMKRKLAEAATASKAGKSRKSKAKAAAAAAAAAAAPPAATRAAPAAGPPGYAASSSSAFPSLGTAAAPLPTKKDADWEKVRLGPGCLTCASSRCSNALFDSAGHALVAFWVQVPKTAGKKKKGKKLEASMLGFASGTDYALLEAPE
jgi:hypothetical protein